MTTWSKWPLKNEDDWKATYTPSPFFTANILKQFMAKYFSELIFLKKWETPLLCDTSF